MITDPGIYFVRHGQTEFDSAGIMQGWHDGPLTEAGKEQSQKVAEKFAELPFIKLFTSDLYRAIGTAAKFVSPTIGGLATPVERCIALRPWNVGGLTKKDERPAFEICKEYVFNRPSEPITDGIVDGESFNDFKDRFLLHVRQAIVQYQAENVNQVHVTHSWNMRLLNAATYADAELIFADTFPLASAARLFHDGTDWQFVLCQ